MSKPAIRIETAAQEIKGYPASSDDYVILRCPMPDCDSELVLSWMLCGPIFTGDVYRDDPPGPDDADVGTWRVECTDGHVILLPGPPGCPEHDDDCEHAESDELRRFQARDLVRLRDTLNAIGTKGS